MRERRVFHTQNTFPHTFLLPFTIYYNISPLLCILLLLLLDRIPCILYCVDINGARLKTKQEYIASIHYTCNKK